MPVVVGVGGSARRASDRCNVAGRRLGRRSLRLLRGIRPFGLGRWSLVELERLEEVVKVWFVFVHQCSRGGTGIVARMAYIALVRAAESWNLWNLIGAALLVGVVVGAMYLATRRS
jgi:hypothetical protein